jgi:hypothetical protein
MLTLDHNQSSTQQLNNICSSHIIPNSSNIFEGNSSPSKSIFIINQNKAIKVFPHAIILLQDQNKAEFQEN